MSLVQNLFLGTIVTQHTPLKMCLNSDLGEKANFILVMLAKLTVFDKTEIAVSSS